MTALLNNASRFVAGLSVLLVTACGGAAAPAAPPSSPAPAASKPAAASQAAPTSAAASAKPAASAAAGGGLESLTAAAKQDGKLIIGFSPNPPLHDAIMPAFEKQFGLQAEQLVSNAQQLANKLVQEKSAGVRSLDVFVASTAAAPTMYDAKLYAPYKPQLVIPDANDASKWIGGKVPFVDPDQNYVARLDRQLRYIVVVNPNVLKPDQLKTPLDLLNPQFKGKIAAMDPTTPGAGQSIAASILKTQGADYVKSLYIGQDVKLTPDQRVLGDWVAHGTYPIGIALPVDEYVTIQNNGLPIARARPEGLTATITSVLLMGMLDGTPHPNAAKL
ncbi:MAG TPA: hypothetical protein VF157_06980, partial [Chloroflexota bacterium]